MTNPEPHLRECPLCHRRFVLLPQDPPAQSICVFCKLEIRINGASKMEPVPHNRPR